jgi:hypothetical protein
MMAYYNLDKSRRISFRLLATFFVGVWVLIISYLFKGVAVEAGLLLKIINYIAWFVVIFPLIALQVVFLSDFPFFGIKEWNSQKLLVYNILLFGFVLFVLSDIALGIWLDFLFLDVFSIRLVKVPKDAFLLVLYIYTVLTPIGLILRISRFGRKKEEIQE